VIWGKHFRVVALNRCVRVEVCILRHVKSQRGPADVSVRDGELILLDTGAILDHRDLGAWTIPKARSRKAKNRWPRRDGSSRRRSDQSAARPFYRSHADPAKERKIVHAGRLKAIATRAVSK